MGCGFTIGDSKYCVCVRWYINHDTADPSYVTNQTLEAVTGQEEASGLLVLHQEAGMAKFQDVVMRLRSPLKQDSDTDQYNPNFFSVIKLHFVIRDKQFRIEDGYEDFY